jgi:hypothetical protein
MCQTVGIVTDSERELDGIHAFALSIGHQINGAVRGWCRQARIAESLRGLTARFEMYYSAQTPAPHLKGLR